MVDITTVGDLIRPIAPFLIGIFTAVSTVGLTLYGTQRKRRLDTLRAIHAEIKSNQQLAEENIESIAKDIERRDSGRGKGWVPLRRFHTEGYQLLKNRGLLFTLSPDSREIVRTHYDFIYELNSLLEFREAKQESMDEQGSIINQWRGSNGNLVIGYNMHSMVYFYAVHPFKVNKEINTEWVENMFEGANVSGFEEALGQSNEVYLQITFSDATSTVGDEIDEHKVLKRFV